MKPRSITIRTEGDKEIALVPLGRRGMAEAVIYLEDYKELIDLGLSGNWAGRAHGVVTAPSSLVPGAKLSVARVLLDAGDKQVVRYIDGNRFNLRRNNLYLEDNLQAMRRERDFIRPRKRQMPTDKLISTNS